MFLKLPLRGNLGDVLVRLSSIELIEPDTGDSSLSRVSLTSGTQIRTTCTFELLAAAIEAAPSQGVAILDPKLLAH